MTVNSAFKKRVRARMKETGEKYTVARRAIEAEDRDANLDESRNPEGEPEDRHTHAR